MFIIHHNDADGRCAAAIAGRWAKEQTPEFNRIVFHEQDYKDPCPVDLINNDEKVVIVDFSFKPPEMEMIRGKTGDIVWCDHHATAEAYEYDLPGLRDFTDKGLCGAEVTWKFFFPATPVPNGVTMLGEYDSWRHTDPDAFAYYEGLKMIDQAPFQGDWENIFNELTGFDVEAIVDDGQLCMNYRDNYCDSMRSSFGFETEIDGHKAYALNIARFGSQAFGEEFKNYPLCIMFIFDGR